MTLDHVIEIIKRSYQRLCYRACWDCGILGFHGTSLVLDVGYGLHCLRTYPCDTMTPGSRR